jgi:hypothetical protein
VEAEGKAEESNHGGVASLPDLLPRGYAHLAVRRGYNVHGWRMCGCVNGVAQLCVDAWVGG